MSGSTFSSKTRVLDEELRWGLLPKLQPAEASVAGEACCQGHTLPTMPFKLSQPLESLCNISILSSATEMECRHFLSSSAAFDRWWNGGKIIRHDLNKANTIRFYSHCCLVRMLHQMNLWTISWRIQCFSGQVMWRSASMSDESDLMKMRSRVATPTLCDLCYLYN